MEHTINTPPVPLQACPDALHPADHLACRLSAILAALALLIAAQFRILGPVTVPLHARINRAARRLARLLVRLAAGRLPRPHVARPGRPGGPPSFQFSRRPAWLVEVLGYPAAGYASQLQALLHNPATQAALAAAPPSVCAAAARTLRPLCRLLGVTLPPTLQPPPAPTPNPSPGIARGTPSPPQPAYRLPPRPISHWPGDPPPRGSRRT